MSGDDGRSVVEAVAALTIIAVTALAWSQMASIAVRTDALVDRRAVAIDLAGSEIERLRVTPAVEAGTDAPDDTDPVDGLAVIVDPAGPGHLETVTIDGFDYVVERLVLDPGSPSWRRLLVTVGWEDGDVVRSVRVDTAIPVLPEPVVS